MHYTENCKSNGHRLCQLQSEERHTSNYTMAANSCALQNGK